MEEVKEMDSRCCLPALGLGMVLGASVVFLIPKHSKAYRKGNCAAKNAKHCFNHAMDYMGK